MGCEVSGSDTKPQPRDSMPGRPAWSALDGPKPSAGAPPTTGCECRRAPNLRRSGWQEDMKTRDVLSRQRQVVTNAMVPYLEYPDRPTDQTTCLGSPRSLCSAYE